MAMHKCPLCGGTSFLVTAHVTQTWEVDGEGCFQEEVSSCDQITHSPDDDDIWTCASKDCFWSGSGKEAADAAKAVAVTEGA